MCQRHLHHMKKFKVSWNIEGLTQLKEAEIVDETSRLVMYAVCKKPKDLIWWCSGQPRHRVVTALFHQPKEQREGGNTHTHTHTHTHTPNTHPH